MAQGSKCEGFGFITKTLGDVGGTYWFGMQSLQLFIFITRKYLFMEIVWFM